MGKYVFVIPAAIIGSFIFGASNAYDNSNAKNIWEVFPSDIQDTLKQNNSKNKLHPINSIDGEKQFIDNINKTYPPGIPISVVNEATKKGSQDTLKTNDPLYVVDGKKQPSLDKINAEDIETISVIKDKAVTTVYGEEGKDGVIEITTKSGKK